LDFPAPFLAFKAARASSGVRVFVSPSILVSSVSVACVDAFEPVFFFLFFFLEAVSSASAFSAFSFSSAARSAAFSSFNCFFVFTGVALSSIPNSAKI
jgi:hypothetical protein